MVQTVLKHSSDSHFEMDAVFQLLRYLPLSAPDNILGAMILRLTSCVGDELSEENGAVLDCLCELNSTELVLTAVEEWLKQGLAGSKRTGAQNLKQKKPKALSSKTTAGRINTVAEKIDQLGNHGDVSSRGSLAVCTC